MDDVLPGHATSPFNEVHMAAEAGLFGRIAVGLVGLRIERIEHTCPCGL